MNFDIVDVVVAYARAPFQLPRALYETFKDHAHGMPMTTLKLECERNGDDGLAPVRVRNRRPPSTLPGSVALFEHE